MNAPDDAASAVAARWRLGSRVALAAVAAFLVCVPFVLLLLLVRTANPALAGLDAAVGERLREPVRGSAALGTAFEALSVGSNPFVLRGITLVVVVRLWWVGRRRLAIWLAVTMAAAGLIGVVLKLVVQRARPTFPDPILIADGYAFPSGHALNSIVFAGCLVVLLHPVLRGGGRAALWSCVVVGVLLVGIDRVALGVHFASDVVAGWVVGAAIVIATVAGFAVWRREEGLGPPDLEAGLDATGPPSRRPTWR